MHFEAVPARVAGALFAALALVLLTASTCEACDKDVRNLIAVARHQSTSADNMLPESARRFMVGVSREKLASSLRACGFKVDLNPYLDSKTRRQADEWLYADRTRATPASLFLFSREVRVIAGAVGGKVITAKAYVFIHGL